jgi:hypothetical protein
MTQYEYLIDAVKEHGESDECLIWPFNTTGGKRKEYGTLTLTGKSQKVHRVTYRLICWTYPKRKMCLPSL